MRMDRYVEEETKNDLKQTRTNKNQELYTDVYLNNVYVDINNLKDVMNQDSETDNPNKDNLKMIKESPVAVSLNYQEKNYDIVSIVEEAIKNKKEDNIKRSLDIGVHNLEIDSLIESINENQKEKEMEENVDENGDLLSDLMPGSDTTAIIPPLEEPILDTAIIDSSMLKEEDEISQDMLDGDITEKDMEIDDSFIENRHSKIKIILCILIVLLLIGIIVGILLEKNII